MADKRRCNGNTKRNPYEKPPYCAVVRHAEIHRLIFSQRDNIQHRNILPQYNDDSRKQNGGAGNQCGVNPAGSCYQRCQQCVILVRIHNPYHGILNTPKKRRQYCPDEQNVEHIVFCFFEHIAVDKHGGKTHKRR